MERLQFRGRIVYYRVLPQVRPVNGLFPESTVAGKLLIKPDSPFADYLENELRRRFDHACCSDLEHFRREKKAITRAGQIKSPGEKHEKDERHGLHDRSRYVLGWSNEAKIQALENKKHALEASIYQLATRADQLDKERASLALRRQELGALAEYRDYRELNWRPLAVEIADLREEKRALETASHVLQELTQRLTVLEGNLAHVDQELTNRRIELGVNENKREDAEKLLDDARLHGKVQREVFERLEQRRGEQHVTLQTCETRERDLRDLLTAEIDAEDKKIARLREKLIARMGEFKSANVLETDDMDVSVEAGDEYRRFLDRLLADDLPRFEQRFKQLLNENTIREIANFQSQLARERETIETRISRINASLKQIEYSPSRYIRLELQPTPDPEIRDFRAELRACTEGALTGSDEQQYSESKFLQVRSIIERLRGREGQTEHDRRWTKKVTDVRNWFLFSASERWLEDDEDFEHYTDSGGKSGGQKEKLAYTILAASLAYQFGLEQGAQKTRTFHFVVIDEAFGRGSDESARFGLELFRRMDLQLLIVTPLQKIHIIEPYVHTVGFVYNRDGNASKLQNMTIEEYRAQKAAMMRS